MSKIEYFVKQKNPEDMAIPSAWRRWTIEAIVSGCDALSIESVLKKQGFSIGSIRNELLISENNPYFGYAKDLYAVCKRRDWLLRAVDKSFSVDRRYSENIERIPCPKFDVFVEQYYSKNLPVILTGGIKDWAALRKWNPDYLHQKFGDCDVEVQYGRDFDSEYEKKSSSYKKVLKMSDFIVNITSVEKSNDLYMTANNAAENMKMLSPLFEDVADFGGGYRDLDTVHSNNLLWFGPKGTHTPMHYDLINNMLVQILGRKKITLVPALQSPFMYNDISVYSAVDFSRRDEERFPLLKNVVPIELELQPGEALFIPIGWWHSVESLDVSISVTFNNFNVENIYFSL